MHGNGVETAMQLFGDVTSREALPNKPKHFLFSRRERLALHDRLWFAHRLPVSNSPVQACEQEAFGSGQRGQRMAAGVAQWHVFIDHDDRIE